MTSLVIPKPLIGHVVLSATGEPDVHGQLYDFILAAHGVYVRARRAEFEVVTRIARCDVRGLAAASERFDFQLPRVPADLVEELLGQAQGEGREGLEVLFHLCFEDGEWSLYTPAQEQTAVSCRATDAGDGSTHQRAVIEVHSHHGMRARFSAVDDADEQGFRLYAVVGNVFDGPEIRVRVGVYGYMREIPASRVFEMPDGLHDALEVR